MPTLDIAGRKVTVGDEFLKLSPDKQNEVVTEIASSLGIESPSSKEGGGTLRAASGLAKALGTGVAKGVADVAGLPGDAVGALAAGTNWLAKKAGLPPVSGALGRTLPNALSFPDSDDTNRAMQSVIGPYREPENVGEKFVESAGRFMPGAAIGPGNVLRNILLYGAVPGVASEAAGQAFKDSPVEPYARVGAGLVAGLGAAATQRAGSAESLVANATKGATSQEIELAENLFIEAQRIGTPISRAEALQAVTSGGTKAGDLQHTVEGMGGMKRFYADRPAQNETAARQAFDTLSPPAQNPSQIGPQAGQAAESVVGGVTQAINRQTRPLYQAAEAQRVGPQVQQALMADPLYAQTLKEVRSNPALNRTIEHLSDDSVGVIDLVQRRMREQADNARLPGQASTSNLAAANFEDARTVPLAAADTVTGSRAATATNPVVAGTYETARNTQQQLRKQYLEPLMNGPIGKIAGQDTTTKAAVTALFPSNPLPNSQAEIGQTMRALSKQRPGVANDLVRAHAEMTFNEAAQRLAAGGFNQSNGAKFAAVLRGNPQQAANLEAAVRALPNGDDIWRGFDRFLDVMEAQQYRQATGSRTAFKIPGVEDLKSGGVLNNAAQVVGGAGIPLSKKVTNAIQNWNVGRNLDEIAHLLTSPDGAQRFRELATVTPNSTQFFGVLNRIGNIVRESGRSSDGATEDE